MSRSAETESRPDFWKKALPLLWCAVILLSGIGAAADDHFVYDKECVLCQLSLFTPAVETCELNITAPDVIGIFVLPESVAPFLELLAAPTASRSPPLSF